MGINFASNNAHPASLKESSDARSASIDGKIREKNSSGPRPIIVFFEDEMAEGEAITEWEAKNGSLFNREPMVIQIRQFSSQPSLQGVFELALKARLKRLEDVLENLLPDF